MKFNALFTRWPNAPESIGKISEEGSSDLTTPQFDSFSVFVDFKVNEYDLHDFD